jgi:hypothetical protein
MFTDEEQPLLTGSADEVADFVDWDRCMIVDWRQSEDETIDDVIRFLPGGVLSYETTYADDDTVNIRIRYSHREDTVTLPMQPQNNFRILLRVWRLLQPEYDIKLFRCTDGSDTQGFLLRPTEWWTAYRTAYPRQYKKVFRDVADLNEMWGLEAPPKPGDAKRRPWWKFW